MSFARTQQSFNVIRHKGRTEITLYSLPGFQLRLAFLFYTGLVQ